MSRQLELMPAIDLRRGSVVRLRQGAFDDLTEFGRDPVGVARRWVGEGARRLHLVDLDGAEQGGPVQLALVERIVRASGVPCQVAGGLRDEAAVAAALAAGADRVVLGTALLEDPLLATRLVALHGADRIAAALDVRDGRAVGQGWVPGAIGRPVLEALALLLSAGVTTMVVTAIARDGLLEGPDLELLGRVRAAAPDVRLTASGGITTLDDLRALADLGCEAAILGRALYEGRLRLARALEVAGG